MILVTSRERTRFIRFAVVGTIGAIVDFTVFNIAIQVFGVPSVWANVISFSVAVISNFSWNRYWTYPDSRSKSIRRQLGQFFAVNLIGVLIRTPIFVFAETLLLQAAESFPRIPAEPATFAAHNLALGGAMVVVLFWNFFVNRYWTYADVD